MKDAFILRPYPSYFLFSFLFSWLCSVWADCRLLLFHLSISSCVINVIPLFSLILSHLRLVVGQWSSFVGIFIRI